MSCIAVLPSHAIRCDYFADTQYSDNVFTAITLCISLPVSVVLCTHARTPAEPPTTTSLSEASSSKKCPKCGTTKKSGKHSCCARGGSWFKKCGDGDDTKFDHTWVEGMQACKDYLSSVSVKTLPQNAIRHVGLIAHLLSSAQPQNGLQNRTTINRPASMSTTDFQDSEDYVRLTKVVCCIYILFVISHLHM